MLPLILSLFLSLSKGSKGRQNDVETDSVEQVGRQVVKDLLIDTPRYATIHRVIPDQ
jgi:hypothetical protein